MRLLAILLVTILGITMSACSRAPDPTSATAPGAISRAYIHGNYAFTGTVVTTHADFTQTTTFTGETTSTTFVIRWTSKLTNMGGSLMLGPTGNVVTMTGVTDQRYDDPEMAVAAATGISAGSAHLMHGLWSGAYGNLMPTEGAVAKTEGHRTTVSGGMASPFTHAVVLESGKVVSVTSVSDPTRSPVEPPEFTDEQFDEILKSTGRSVTPEERARIKADMDKAHAAMREDKSPTTWVTTIDVTGL